MMALCWQLPGPRRFLARVLAAFREGRNVVIGVPDGLPTGLAAALRVQAEEDSWFWDPVALPADPTVDPASWLFDRFVPDAPSALVHNPRTLVAQPGFMTGGRIVWLTGVTAATWTRWRAFLTAYETACRACHSGERTLFGLLLPGALNEQPPDEDVCLAYYPWVNTVERLDMLLFVAQVLQDRPLCPLDKQVAVAVVAELAGWDFELAERLAEASLPDLLDPTALLQVFAQERDWPVTRDAVVSAPWHSGIVNQSDSAKQIHAAALAGAGECSALKRRLWRAQVGVVLPYIEERRQDLLEQLAAVLSVPFTTLYGQVLTDVRDLEVGHIEAQLAASGAPVSEALRTEVRCLREARNRLAHLEPLDYRTLQRVGSH
jgi:hypothetical protein